MNSNSNQCEKKTEVCPRCDGKGWNPVLNDDFEDMGFKRGCSYCGGRGATRIPLVSTFSTMVKGSGKVEVTYEIDRESGERIYVSAKPKRGWF
jgi:DnaJ-class molecular chaperone